MEESPVSSISGSESDSPAVLSAISVELGKTSREQKQALERYKEAEKWIWSECSTGGSALKATKAGLRREARVLVVCDVCHELYTSKDKHCQCCHATFDKSSSPRVFSEHTRDCEEKRRKCDPNWKLQGPVASMPSRLQLLKTEIIKIEVRLYISYFGYEIHSMIAEDVNCNHLLDAVVSLSFCILFHRYHQYCHAICACRVLFLPRRLIRIGLIINANYGLRL